MTQDEKNQVFKMQEQLRDVDKSVNEIKNNVSDIHKLLAGDDFGSTDGLVSEYKDIKSRVKALEDIKKKVIWVATGAGLAGGIVLDKIIAFIKSVFLITILFLFVSCSIFKRIEKTIKEARTVYSLDSVSSANTKVKNSLLYHVKENIRIRDSSFRQIWLKADNIMVGSDGSITATANAEYWGFNQVAFDSLANRQAFEKSNTDYSKITEESVKEKEELKTVDKSISSKPSGKGVIYGVVGVLIFVLGVLWWFGVKPVKG